MATKRRHCNSPRALATCLAILCCSKVVSRPDQLTVDCAPIKLASDLPSIALAALAYGSNPEEHTTILPHHHHMHHHSASPAMSSSSAEDDSDEDSLEALYDAMRDSALSKALKIQIAAGRFNETEQSFDANLTSSSLAQQQSVSQTLSNKTTQRAAPNNTAVIDTLSSNSSTTTSATTSNYTSSQATTTTSSTTTTTAVPRLYNLLVPPTVSRDSHLIRLPNGQSVQFCDETTGTCDDENAICKLGACVCKTGYFPNPNIRGQSQPGLCQSISDLLKNCDNDLQCKAFGVEFICDTKSHDRPFCDCAEGFYFDQETYTCLPCHRNTLVLTSMKFYSTPPGSSTPEPNGSSDNVAANQSSPAADSASAAGSGTPKSTAEATTASTVVQHQPQLRPCKPYDRLGSRRRPPKPYFSSGSSTMSGTAINTPNGMGQINPEYTSVELTPRQFSNSGNINSSTASDPLRIRIPLEVFMGAVMLFTAFTVAWLFLQRMIHDCRAIMRSLRGADVISRTMNVDPNFGPMPGLGRPTYRTSAANAHFLDPAVAQLLTGEMSDGACNGNLAATLAATNANYQREIGVMVQHLTANLSPSSTSHALAAAAANSGGSVARNITPHLLSTYNEHEATLYPFAAGGQQPRTATQLLLAPNHPALAILRAAASVAQQNSALGDCGTAANVLSSMLDPPPKYEEAMAQTQQQQQPDQQTSINQPPYMPPEASSGSSPESDVGTLRLDQADGGSDRLNEAGTNDFNESTTRNDETLSRSQNQDLSSMLNVYISPNTSQPGSDDLLAIQSASMTNSSGNNTDSSAAGETKANATNEGPYEDDPASVASSQPINLGSRPSADSSINERANRRSSNDNSELMRTNPRTRRLSDANRSRRRRLTRRSRRRSSTTTSNNSNNQDQAQPQGQHDNRSSDEVNRAEDDG